MVDSAKRGSNGITSCFVVRKTNLFLSYSLTHAGGGMESVASEEVSLSTHMPKTSSAQGKGMEGHLQVTHH